MNKNSLIKYETLVMGMFLMICAGTLYLYGEYEPDLKDRANILNLNYGQRKTNFIGTMMQIGTWFSVTGGIFYDYFGPRLTALLGGIIASCGYLLLALIFYNKIRASYEIVGLMGWLMGQGSAWLYTSALNTTCMNFPSVQRGKVAGLLVCFFGISAAIFVQFYTAFFQPSVQKLFVFLAIVQISLGSGFGTIFSRRIDTNSISSNNTTDAHILRIMFSLTIFLAIYLAFASIIEQFESSKNVKLGFCMGLCFILIILALIPFLYHKLQSNQIHHQHNDNNNKSSNNGDLNSSEDDRATLIKNVTTTSIHNNNYSNNDDEDEDIEIIDTVREIHAFQMMQTLEFWCLFTSFLLVIGCGVSVIANLGSFVHSLGGTDSMKNTLATLLSVSNAFGRMLFGYLSDHYLPLGMCRSKFLVITCVIMCLVHLYLAFASINMLYVGICVCGLAYGGVFCLTPVMTSEMFGLKHFGGNFGVMGLGPAIGSYAISTTLAGRLYDNKANEHDKITGKSICLGHACYHETFLITSGLCALSVLTSIGLVFARQRHRVKSYREV